MIIVIIIVIIIITTKIIKIIVPMDVTLLGIVTDVREVQR